MNTGTQRVAVFQAAPKAFDLESTLVKAEKLTPEAAKRGARLVLFPEAFVGAYARGLSFGATVGNRSIEGRDEYRAYWDAGIDVPGPATARLGALSRQNDVKFGPRRDQTGRRDALLHDPFFRARRGFARQSLWGEGGLLTGRFDQLSSASGKSSRCLQPCPRAKLIESSERPA